MKDRSVVQVFRRLKPYLRPYRGTIILTLLLGAGLAAIPLGLMKFVQIMIDDVFVKKDTHMLIMAPCLAVILYTLSGFLRFFHMYLLRYTGERVGFDLRNDLQAHYANLSLNFHGENTSGALISKTTNDVINIQMGLNILADVIREPLAFLGVLAYLFYTNWKMTCIALLAAPLLIIISKSLGRSVRKYSFMQQIMFEEFTNVLKETLDGIRIVKAFNLEYHMRDRFRDTTRKILKIRRKILRREELAGPLFELLSVTTGAFIFYFAGSQVIRGEVTQGAIMALFTGFFTLSAPIKKLQDAHVRFQHTIASTERVFDILDTQVEVKDPEESGRVRQEWPKNWETIILENINFSYGNKKILNGINLTVKRGEVLAIVGASGAGKTTLVNLLPRFFDVTTGAIKVGGVDIRDMGLKDLRAHIGLVTQDVFLFNETIQENILGAEKTLDQGRLNHTLESAHATEFISKFENGIRTIVGERGSKLSGGERQRISIARALFKDAPLLILDEATSSLDSQSEKTVQEALDELMKGRTTFVIAHRLSTIQKAHRIVVLSDGKIIEQGSHSELLTQGGLYQTLHSTQFGSVERQ